MTLPLRETKVMRPSSTNDSVTIKYVSGRNNYNLPSSHRLNLGINFRHMTKRGNQALWNLCLYNAYNAMNPNFVYYQFKTDKDTGEMTNEIRLTKVTILPILPAFSYTLSF